MAHDVALKEQCASNGSSNSELVMKEHAFYPERIIEQIKAFFADVHDISGFYYKLYLLNGLCRRCDGRGYLETPAHLCTDCQGSGDADIWHRAKLAKRYDAAS